MTAPELLITAVVSGSFVGIVSGLLRTFTSRVTR